jgi:hypothetical protein
MIINNTKRFIFYHVPKAAGSSVHAALRTEAGSRKVRGSRHLTPNQFLSSLNLLQRWKVKNYFTFCFVRNPFERFGSAHRYLLNHEVGRRNNCPEDVNDFASLLAAGKEWVLNLRSMTPQARYTEHVSFVGRFENLEQDFSEICERLAIIAPLGHANSSGESTRYFDTLTSTTRSIIYRHFHEDFERAID